MKKIKQFVFYGDGNNNNEPKSINAWTGNLLAGYSLVSHLGIQGAPGTGFYLNNGGDLITIGSTGVYELDLTGIGHLTSLYFNKSILVEKYNNHINPNHRLIVDIVYEGV